MSGRLKRPAPPPPDDRRPRSPEAALRALERYGPDPNSALDAIFADLQTPHRTAQARADVAEAARAFSMDALEVLAAVMLADEFSPATRVSAALAILARGHGRPAQAAKPPDADTPTRQVLRWAQTDEEGTMDPSAGS